MTDTENRTALCELENELEKAVKELENDIVRGIYMLKDAVNNYSEHVKDYRITEYTDKILHYSDVEQIIIDKAKEDGLRGVVWFLDDIDRYNCDNYFYLYDSVFGCLQEIDVVDVLIIIDEIREYLTTK